MMERALASLTAAVARADDLDSAVVALFEHLGRDFGLQHATLFLGDDERDALVAVATRGYPEGAGAEVKRGEGLLGVVTQTRKAVRFGAAMMERRYGKAARTEAARAGHAVAREVPAPGLPDARSVLAVPVQARGEVLGVIAVESRAIAAFSDVHEAALSVAADVLALALLMLRDDEADDDVAEAPAHATGVARRATFYKSDDSVLFDDEYVVKSLPGRILWKLLREFAERGRTSFSNKELRLDPTLKLPAVKDNLESRLILLRRRLEEKFPFARITPTARGRFTFVVDGGVQLVVVDG